MDSHLNTKPVVSVVMSVYNSAPYLKEAIDSILNQSFRDFEFIIINDGSKDDSLSIIKSYNDPRIVLIDNVKNKGLIYSLNKGIAEAKGEFIARMDSDDVSLAERLKVQLSFMKSNPEVGVCGCDYVQFYGSHEERHFSFMDHDSVFSFLFFNSSVVHPTLMIRKTVLNELNHLFDENYKHAEDYELWSRLIFRCKFSAVPEMLFKYRIHEHQVTNVHNKVQIESANKIRENLLRNAGFNFSKEELRVHCLLGSSALITSFDDLMLLGTWLQKMVNQNKQTGLVQDKTFTRSMHKMWFDACGNTNLGLRAFSLYSKFNFNSDFKTNKTKLLVKCLVRRFKK